MKFVWVASVGVGCLFGCSGPGSIAPSPPPCGQVDALVAASDYSSSALVPLALDGRQGFIAGVDLGKDPALASSRGRPFWIARDTGFIFELDPQCGQARARLDANDPARNGSSNPQDIGVGGDGSLWIPRFAIPSVLVLQADGSPRTAVDLSLYDIDGNPNMNAIGMVDMPSGESKALVSLERLDDTHQLSSTRPSMMVRIDTTTSTVEAELQLAGRNPFGLMAQTGDALYLAEPGSFDAIDEGNAGIERVDIQSFTSKLLIAEHDLGASAVEVAVTKGCGAAVVADPTPTVNATSLVTFDPDSGTVLTSGPGSLLSTPAGFKLEGLAWKGTSLLVGDRSSSARGFIVHIFDLTGTCELHERMTPLFLPQMPLAIRATG